MLYTKRRRLIEESATICCPEREGGICIDSWMLCSINEYLRRVLFIGLRFDVELYDTLFDVLNDVRDNEF